MFEREYLQDVLDYNPETGIARWKERSRTDFEKSKSHKTWNSQHAGREAGNISTRDWRYKVSLFSITVSLDILIAIREGLGNATMFHRNKWNCDNRLNNLTPAKSIPTKFQPSDLILKQVDGIYHIFSDSQYKLPHCCGRYESHSLAKLRMIELADKFQTGFYEDA
jgi:hypothetical protein